MRILPLLTITICVTEMAIASDVLAQEKQLPKNITSLSGDLVVPDTNFFSPISLSEQQSSFTLPTSSPASSLEISQIYEYQTDAPQSNTWHFLFQPSLYLPVTIYGDATYGEFSGDISFDSDEIRTAIKDDLNFAFFGDFQAWTPDYSWGLLANFNYLSSSSEDTLTRSVRLPGFVDFVPSELEAEVDTTVWDVNLTAAYRFYDRSKVDSQGVSTEFDLGTFVFDIIGGLNITNLDADLELSTNLGGQAESDRGDTVISPVLGGKLRVNTSPKLAVVTEGAVSGFGIDGLTQWNVRTGLDWMFSGKTSLGLGYRFGSVNYSQDTDNDRDFELNLDQNGPYLSFGFRF